MLKFLKRLQVYFRRCRNLYMERSKDTTKKGWYVVEVIPPSTRSPWLCVFRSSCTSKKEFKKIIWKNVFNEYDAL